MAEYSVGLFLIPEEHLDEVYELEAARDAAQDANDWDALYRGTQIFLGSQRRAVESLIVSGDDSWDALIPLASWLQTRFLGGRDRAVWAPADVETLRQAVLPLEYTTLERWVARRKRQYDDIDHGKLRQLFEGLQSLLRAAGSGRFGLAVCMFSERDREPPEVPTYPSGPIMAPEDNAMFTARFEYLARCSYRRGLEWWPDVPGDGRMLLGFLPADVGPHWHAEWLEGAALLRQGRMVAGWRQRARLVTAIEPVLEEPTILTLDGPVQAHGWLSTLTCVEHDGMKHQELLSPDLVPVQIRRFEEEVAERGGEDAFVDSIWDRHRHWRRDTVRAAYDQIRGYLDRALKRQCWLVWMHDKYTGWPP